MFVIENQDDYEKAMSRLSELMDKDFSPHSPLDDELEALVLIIEDYERDNTEQ